MIFVNEPPTKKYNHSKNRQEKDIPFIEFNELKITF